MIAVEALGKRREFADIAELGEYVATFLDASGGIFDPFELAAIRALSAAANGEAPPRVHQIARTSAFFEPPRPPKLASPFDKKIGAARTDAEAKDLVRAEAVEALHDARAEATRIVRAAEHSGGTDAERAGRVIDAMDRASAIVQGAEADWRIADEVALRARARANALEAARMRYRADEESRWSVPGVDKALTLAELRAWREEHER